MNHKRTVPGIKNRPAGSPAEGELAYHEAGFVRRPHGVKGELLVEVDSNYKAAISPGSVIYLGENHLPMNLFSCRPHNQGLLIQLDEIINPEQAGQYRLQPIFVSSSVTRKELQSGDYYSDEIIGLSVRDDLDHDLGKVTEIIETGANDVYVVSKPGGRDVLLPAIPDVIRKIDIEKGELTVHILPGLMDI